MRTIHFRIIILAAAVMLLALAQPACAVNATGGDTTNVIDGYRIHTFTNSATFSVITGGNVDVLVVAGGGGGGFGGGGGGAGGFLLTNLLVEAGSYAVTVGLGGAGRVTSGGPGENGQNSVCGAVTAIGGGGGGSGGGGSGGELDGQAGGSGGGAARAVTYQSGGSGTPGQGYNGGNNRIVNVYPAGGGGGALSAGQTPTSDNGGAGGSGTNLVHWLLDLDFGDNGVFAGGGGGGTRVTAPGGQGGEGGGGQGGGSAGLNGTNALPNTGGGGGGGGQNSSYASYPGGAGGSGIVIVRYRVGVDNADGATNVASTSAWLNGTLLSADDPNTVMMVFWGTIDGNTNASAWAKTNIWAAPQTPGAFTVHATGLSPDSTYCYRFAASNTAGWAWALEASVFITGNVWINKTADASEIGPTPGTFTVHRVSSATNEALNLTYTVGGTAIPDVDYTALNGTVTIPKGAQTATIEVMPIFDHFQEGTETVVLTLTHGPYMIGTPASATMNIADYGLVTRTWSGGGANALASNPTNWVEGEAPIAGDSILLDNRTGKAMTWDLNIPLRTWAQTGYLGTVTVATVYGPAGLTNLVIQGDCIINDGVWTHIANTSQEANRLRVVVGGNLIIGTNGTIDATGKGYNSAGYRGPGGGASGGYGGRAYIPWNIEQAGYCYGSITAPINIGSAGGTSGGGSIHITISGFFSNNGTIRANGWPAVYYNGSGGGIYLVAGAMAGAGTIEANGGYCTSGDGGGGGRVALVVTNATADFSSYTGTVCALSGGLTAGAGTVYLETSANGVGRGTVLIDAGGGGNHKHTEMNTNVMESVFATIVIRNSANFAVAQNHSIEVSGIWSNKATFTGLPGSSVVFSDRYTATSVIYGSTTFMRLIATNEGTTLLFEPGPINRLAAGGSLILRGSASQTNLFLRSTSPGQAWKLNIDGAAEPSIFYVDVQNSDASSGSQVTAFFSRDSGGNSNWVFSSALPGITNVWTGAESTLWNVGANWQSGRAPYDEDFIRIPVGPVKYPVINGMSRTVAGLEIEGNASLSLNGYDLTVKNYAILAGALICSAGETVTFCGNTYFTGGAFSPASSTVIFSGDLPQAVAPDDLTFHKIIVDNTNTVTFTDGFSVYAFLIEPPVDEMRKIVFNSGDTVTVDFLTLLSAPATTNIMLRSSSAGQSWRLNAVKGHSIRGVAVKDCDASSGQTIYASGSRDNGNNINWNFTQNWVEWTGATGNGLFSNATNWWPMGIPGESDWVRVANALPMTIAAPVAIRSLTVGGGTPAAQVTANATLNVLENVQLLTNGTLTLNRSSVVGSNLDIQAGGLLTHSGNSAAEVNKLDVTVYGNMAVHTNGSVDVASKGYAGGQGPGGSGGVVGGSYGGRGSSSSKPCYGSFIAPTNLGSGGGYAVGGGAIQLTVSGELRNDGLVCADSGSSPYPTGSGGSIWLTAGAILGTGTIRANGIIGGGGGRLSLVVTNTGADLQEFRGLISAFGGGGGYGSGGGGTIYSQNAANEPGRGTVLVNNNYSANTDIPPGLPNVTNEVNFVSFLVTNSARLRLTDDFIIGDIHLQSANAWLDLGFKTLIVRSRAHPIGPGAATNVTNYGAIIWWPDIPKGIVFSTW